MEEKKYPELVKGTRFQHIFPEPYFTEGLSKEQFKAKEDVENYYDNLPFPLETIKEELLQYNNSRLQCLLTLYYTRNTEATIYYIYKSVFRTYKDSRTGRLPESTFLYKTLWADMKNFFAAFHDDFVTNYYYSRWFFSRKPESLADASKFCETYFMWLAVELSKKGKVSFEEVEKKIKSLL